DRHPAHAHAPRSRGGARVLRPAVHEQDSPDLGAAPRRCATRRPACRLPRPAPLPDAVLGDSRDARGDGSRARNVADRRSRPVQHPGGAVGYRLEEGGKTLAFIPDNELGLDADAGVELATGADILFHDAQYTDAEYPSKVGWGHSSLSDFATFVRRTEPGRAL